jgi:opacity protein-like surface antigen
MKRLLGWSGALLLLGALAGLPAGEARALDTGWYVNLGAGTNHLDVESSIRTEPDLGYRLVASAGYQFNRNWALELDTGFMRNTYSKSTSASRRDNPLEQVPVVLNGIYSFTSWSRVEPFVGVGGGVLFMSYGSSSGGDAALGFKGGARYLLHERLGLGVDYTFFMLGATSAIVEEPVGCDTMNFTLHWMF